MIQELLLADLAKTQYTRDDEGPYSRINLDQHIPVDNELYCSYAITCNLA